MRTLWPREFYRSILLHGHACSREDGSEEPGWGAGRCHEQKWSFGAQCRNLGYLDVLRSLSLIELDMLENEEQDSLL